MIKHTHISFLFCSLFALLLALTSDSKNDLSSELEMLTASTRRVVIGDYVISRSRNGKKDHTFNVWTNIVDRQQISAFVNLLSMTNKPNDVGAGFASPVAVQIFLGTNDVPIKVIELQLSQESDLYSVEEGFFFDGRLSGSFCRDVKFMNYMYCREIFSIARKTPDGLFAVLSEEERNFKHTGERITVEELIFKISVGGQTEDTNRIASTNTVESAVEEKPLLERESGAGLKSALPIPKP